MTTKKKNTPREESSTMARPRMLIAAVVVASTASTWIWYRPLETNQNPGGQPSEYRGQGAMASEVLIEPNTNDSIAGNLAIVPVYADLPEDLVGDGSLQLRPFQPIPQGTLQERLSKEPLPVIPISRPEGSAPDRIASSARRVPPIWTNLEPTPDRSLFGESLAGRSGARLGSADRIGADWESASPMKTGPIHPRDESSASNTSNMAGNAQIQGNRIVAIAPAKKASSGWPDTSIKSYDTAAFNPPLMKSSKEIPNQYPPDERHQGKIVLAENHSRESVIAPSEAAVRKSIPTSWSNDSAVRADRNGPVKKSGAVIRQPGLQ